MVYHYFQTEFNNQSGFNISLRNLINTYFIYSAIHHLLGSGSASSTPFHLLHLEIMKAHHAESESCDYYHVFLNQFQVTLIYNRLRSE